MGVTSFETWKDLPGYEGLYLVSDKGNVIGVKRGQQLRAKTTTNGYKGVALCKDGKPKHVNVHRLVCMAFLLNPSGLKYVNHKNGIKTDNNVENLEWCTASQNIQHSYDIGLSRQDGEFHASARLTWEKVRAIRFLKLIGVSSHELGAHYAVHHGHINNICSNKFWKDNGRN